jgi:hypothetical protein
MMLYVIVCRQYCNMQWEAMLCNNEKKICRYRLVTEHIVAFEAGKIKLHTTLKTTFKKLVSWILFL